MLSVKNVIVALLIITASIRVVAADHAAVPKLQKELSVTIIQANAGAVQELQVVTVNVVYLVSGITVQQDVNHATVMRTLPSELGVTLKRASVLVCLVL